MGLNNFVGNKSFSSQVEFKMLMKVGCQTSKTMDQHTFWLKMANAPYKFPLVFFAYLSCFGYTTPGVSGGATGLSSEPELPARLLHSTQLFWPWNRSCLLLHSGPEGKSRDSCRSFSYPSKLRRRWSLLNSSSCGSMCVVIFAVSARNYWF